MARVPAPSPDPPHTARRMWRRVVATGRLDGRHAALAFNARLCVAIAATSAVIGVVGLIAISGQLERRLIATYAEEHAAEAQGLENAAGLAGLMSEPSESDREVQVVLRAVVARPGTLQALVIDRRRRVDVAAEYWMQGMRVSDPAVERALTRGRTFAGRSGDRSFEFVAPVDLPDGRHAFKVVRDRSALNAERSAVRRTLIVIGLAAFVVGSLIFYLVGGRALVRSHRHALRRASRDGLTDLPNARAFAEDLGREMDAAARYGDALSLVVLDLDDFTFLNDTHGHAHGDAVLRRLAGLLLNLRAGDRAYRVGGDEFAVVLTRTDAAGARAASRRLSRALDEARIAASGGLAVMRPGHEARGLLAEANAALDEARRHGGGKLVHFDDVRESVAVNRPETVRAVHRLLSEGRVTTAFQPIWDLRTGALLAVEALTRPAPDYGLAGPAQAFDVAEQIGQVGALDRLCVASALRSVRGLPADVLLFMNIAPQTLEIGVDDWLAAAVRDAGRSPAQVVVEVTERFGGRVPAVLRGLRRLRDAGFAIALDDVGTGNSGLEMLREVGAEFVKLDRSIVAAAPTESNARAVLLAMATFAFQTGAFVIAEGIEDADLLEYVRSLGSTLGPGADAMIAGGQGYGLGRPAPDLPAPGARLELLVREAA